MFTRTRKLELQLDRLKTQTLRFTFKTAQGKMLIAVLSNQLGMRERRRYGKIEQYKATQREMQARTLNAGFASINAVRLHTALSYRVATVYRAGSTTFVVTVRYLMARMQRMWICILLGTLMYATFSVLSYSNSSKHVPTKSPLRSLLELIPNWKSPNYLP
jgi:Mg2+/citrate symporter